MAFPAVIPLPSPSEPRTRRASRLRRSLRLSVFEGLVAEIVSACSGTTVLTGWALHVRASPITLGLIVALPQLAQLLQIPAAWLTSQWGSRSTALRAVSLSRLSLLLLCPLPWVPGRSLQELVLLCVAATSAALAVIGNNAWVTWMSELVPRAIRGRYFGFRTALATAASAVGTMAAGAFLDLLRRHGHEGGGLSALALVAAGAGVLAFALMRQQHSPANPAGSEVSFREVLKPLRYAEGRSLVTFQVAWNMAVGLAASFFTVFMLQNLRMSFTAIAAYGVVTSTSKVLFAPRWGRLIDRFGARAVVASCSFAIALIPFLWLWASPQFLWPVVLDAIATGIFWSGHNLALFQLPFEVAPQRGRAWYLAVFSTAAGVTFACATAFGGWAVSRLPHSLALGDRAFDAYQLLFACSGVARLLAATVSLRLAREDRPVASPRMIRELVGGLFG